MRFVTSNQIASAVLGLALALPGAAWAQSVTAPAVATTVIAGAVAAGQTEDARKEKVEQRIADLHATLNITPAQEKVWDPFAQVMLDNAQAMQETHALNAEQADTRSAQEIMQAYVQAAQQHAQNMEKLSAAFATVYAVLTPDQKNAADDMFRMKAEKHAEK